MAKVQFGAGITSVNGKIAGWVFQGTGAKAIVRRKTKPRRSINRSVNIQQLLMSQLNAIITQNRAQLPSLWRGLTDEQRAAWATISYKSLTPFQLFIRANQFVYPDGPSFLSTPQPLSDIPLRILNVKSISRTPDGSVIFIPELSHTGLQYDALLNASSPGMSRSTTGNQAGWLTEVISGTSPAGAFVIPGDGYHYMPGYHYDYTIILIPRGHQAEFSYFHFYL